MTIRPPPGFPLPELVLVANRMLIEEAETLRTALRYLRPSCGPMSIRVVGSRPWRRAMA